MDFGAKLYSLRKEKGMTQEDLAQALDVARQTISKWELGETVPDMTKLMELSKIFDVSIDELVGYENKNRKSKFHYEYKSKKTFWGLPLVHIHFGTGLNRAKGIIAIGNVATGLISIGLLSLGLICFGPLGIGLFCLCSLGLGGVALGGFVVGILAIGGISIGIFSIGGISIGIYSIGGIAIAKNIAYGGIAYGKIAIGEKVYGSSVFQIRKNKPLFKVDDLKNQIHTTFPNLWNWIVNLFCGLV